MWNELLEEEGERGDGSARPLQRDAQRQRVNYTAGSSARVFDVTGGARV